MEPPEQQRQKPPKEGFGPRGAPDCYYTSRVLNSTFRYVKFVRKLRALEEEQRKGAALALKDMKDNMSNSFFIRCDRRSLINNVARRVDLCIASYEEDLNKKRVRLKDLLSHEEELNIRKFVEQAQAGAEAVWQDKKDRLEYLLQKRKKEHEEKYKDTPLSKCVHALPCIYKLRAKEAAEIHLYQIKEKQARKMAEKEFDKMWHEVAMKESDALAARMEQDTIERYRRDLECKKYSDYQLEERRKQREREKAMLKEEALRLKSIWESDILKEEEAERKRAEQRQEMARDRKETMEEREKVVAKQQAKDKLIADTWDSLAGQGLAYEKAEEELRRRKERDLDECNRKMIELKEEIKRIDQSNDEIIKEVAKQQQDVIDKSRCQYLIWSRTTNKEVRQAMVGQIKDRELARRQLEQRSREEDEYRRQLQKQLDQLVAHKELTDAQARKLHQRHLLDQIEYNKLLKDRARQEELEQIKKCEIATKEYQEEINKMVCRPFHSEEIHPFMKQMAKGLTMKEKCPCSKPNYCK